MQMRELRKMIADIRTRPAARQALVDLYDGEIHWCDRHVRQLCEMLGAASNTLVIVSADHGEEFLEHNDIGHGENLFEPTVRVPLLIRFPDGRHAGKTVTAPVSNKDILPTLADFLEISCGKPVPGDSLLPLIEQPAAETRAVFFELDRGSDWKGVRQGDWKFLLRPRKGKKDMLFNLREDAAEQTPAQFTHPQVATQLRELLENWMSANPVYVPAQEGPRLNTREQETLRSLGYLR
jgi:arylsulfatase A-like enzyme